MSNNELLALLLLLLVDCYFYGFKKQQIIIKINQWVFIHQLIRIICKIPVMWS